MNVNFGFSYIGLIFLLMLMLPNIVWSKNKPKDYDKYVKNENRVLLLFERVGEISVTCLSLIFRDFNINEISGWTVILLIAFVLMVLYEVYWIRYFRSAKTMKDMYSSLLGYSGGRCNIASMCILSIEYIWQKPVFICCSNHIGDWTYWNTLES